MNNEKTSEAIKIYLGDEYGVRISDINGKPSLSWWKGKVGGVHDLAYLLAQYIKKEANE